MDISRFKDELRSMKKIGKCRPFQLVTHSIEKLSQSTKEKCLEVESAPESLQTNRMKFTRRNQN